ncbi:DNA topoisomerase III [Tieghemostelium lacteum]|uniref:DNA topoisomerase n=1 Tax=Tieghemostelium lacteum TaxID=361077 RepID=A0A151ZKF9_TIELA|nr:DNA topoisomerase III [Tieghemostelium lacteum]|eukprot:KYQ94399.1 DNA topoisomerase III [Tieghemostelium lacteum]
MKVLNVAEKPSAAQEISSLLAKGRANKRQGLSKFNPVWEFPYELNGEKCTMTFTSVTGHLMTTDVVEPYNKWGTCSPIDLFEVGVHKFVPEANKPILRSLETESRAADVLILWLDCDREGENIAFEVLGCCLKVKKSLRVYRARFSSIIQTEISKAMRTLGEPNKLDSIAVDTRIEIDLRLGAAFTRFQTNYLNQRFQIKIESNSNNNNSGSGDKEKGNVISYGPCQFPTLGFVVERYLRIINFKAEDFWKIAVGHEKKVTEPGGGDKLFPVDFSWKRKRLFDHSTAFMLYEKCLESPEATVTDVQSKDSRYRPLPLTTIELQKLAAKKLKMSSVQIMNCAEELYNEGLISYPRTETDSFQEGTEFNTLIEAQYQSPQWGRYAEDLLKNGKFLLPKSGRNNDNSHPPIHPVKFAGNLTGPKKNLYEMITRRFLACCSNESVYGNITITIEIAGEYFTETGTTLKQLGYLEVYPYDKRSDKMIPPFTLGERFTPKSMELVQGKTQAPNYMSEVELLTAMDNNKIGTDATMAQHIQKIQERNYVEKVDNKFHPTKLGIALIAGYDSMGFEFSKPLLRALIESDVNLISTGKRTKEQVLKDTLEKYKQLFIKANQQATCFDVAFQQFYPVSPNGQKVEQPNFSKCGKCQKKMDLISTSSGEFNSLYCNQCHHNLKLPKKGIFSANINDCKICGFQAVTVTSEVGTSYNVCPKCRNNPPSFFTENPPFHCFQCTNKECSLATNRDRIISKPPPMPFKKKPSTTYNNNIRNKDLSF